jgi:hypothetical protein
MDRTGLELDGTELGWTGIDRTVMPWTGLDGAAWTVQGGNWKSLNWYVPDWTGWGCMDHTGLDWKGLNWWTEIDRTRQDRTCNGQNGTD